MTGIFERIAGLAGTELSKAVNLAHGTFQDRMTVHKHTGRALAETAAEVCRNHPNLVGIGAGLLVERLLVEEKHRHDAHLKTMAEAEAPEPALTLAGSRRGGAAAAKRAKKNRASKVKLHKIRPMRIAFEVLGGLMLLKLGALGSRLFRRRQEPEIWFAPAARIHMISAAIATYNLAAAIRSPRISALRNGAVAFFGTAALKPVLKTRLGAQRAPSSAPAPSTAPTPADPASDQGTISLNKPWTLDAVPVPTEPVPVEPKVAEPASGGGLQDAPVHVDTAAPEAIPAEPAQLHPEHAEPSPDAPGEPPAATEPPWASFSKVSQAIREIADPLGPETPTEH